MKNHITILAIFVSCILLITMLGGCVNCAPKERMEGMRNKAPAAAPIPQLPMGAPVVPPKVETSSSGGQAGVAPTGFDYSDMTASASDVSSAFAEGGVSGSISKDVSASATAGKPFLS